MRRLSGKTGFVLVGSAGGGAEGVAVAALVAEVGNVDDLVLLFNLKDAVVCNIISLRLQT